MRLSTRVMLIGTPGRRTRLSDHDQPERPTTNDDASLSDEVTGKRPLGEQQTTQLPRPEVAEPREESESRLEEAPEAGDSDEVTEGGNDGASSVVGAGDHETVLLSRHEPEPESKAVPVSESAPESGPGPESELGPEPEVRTGAGAWA